MEDEEKVGKIYSKLAAGWLELSKIIRTLPEGDEKERLERGKKEIQNGLNNISFALGVPLK